MFGRKSFKTWGTISANWHKRLARLISAESPRINFAIFGADSPALRKIERIRTYAFCKYGSVFHCTDPDFLCDVDLLCLIQVGIFFIDNFARAPACFLEKLAQRHVFARPRFHQLAIFTQDAAKRDVAKIRLITLSPGNLENLFEMQDLRGANHVPNGVGFQIVQAIIDSRDIGGGVIKSAVAFANDARLISQLWNIAKENDNRAVADLSNAGLEQTFDYVREPVIVKTFTALDVVMNIEHFIHMLEVLHGEGDAFVPDVDIFLVAGLQFYQLLATGFPNLGIAGRQRVRLLVNADDLCQGILLKRALVQQVLPAVNHHTELSPPVADVIVADHFVPEKRCDARQCIAQDGASDVADVHRLGHIRRSEVNHDAPRRFCFRHAKSFIAQDAGGFFRNGARTQCKIDETGPCDHWGFANVANVKVPDDFLRNFPRIFAPLLSEHQSRIRLVIAESRIGCWR